VSETLHVPEGAARAEIYAALLPQIEAVVAGVDDVIANLANVAAILKQAFDFHWVGFYRTTSAGMLTLGPFQGPLACVTMTSLGLLLGTLFEARNLGLMFGFVVLPLTFLGGTYYQWTKLAPVQVAGIHWLQIIVLLNPLIYVAEGMRAGLTEATHMPLYVIYPVLIGFATVFLTLGLRKFRGRVLS